MSRGREPYAEVPEEIQNKETLEKLYETMSATAIAKKFKSSKFIVDKWLRIHEIKIHSNSGPFAEIKPGIYNNAEIIEQLPSKNRETQWNCRCKCGNMQQLSRTAISRGAADCKQCRIAKMAKRQWKGYEEISGDFFNRIKRGAEQRSIDFDISIEYIWELFIQQSRQCIFSGEVLVFAQSLRENRSTSTASLDRIDSSKGYIVGNVQWIHKQIQTMKWNRTDEEFIEWCHKISKHNS